MGFFDIGTYAGSTGTYNLGETATLTVNTNEYVGDIGTGFFNQMGGTHNINGSGNQLYLGYNSAGTALGTIGTYTLSAGTLSVNNGGNEFVGFNFSGIFNQTGGTNTATSLFMGNSSGSTGTYSLSGTGTLSTGNEYIGNMGSALFDHSGGMNTMGGLVIGFASGPGSTYNLRGTGILSVNGDESIGLSGTANLFNQTGGTHNISGELDLGTNVGAIGTFLLSGGTASASTVFVGGTSAGQAGSGVVTVSGTGVLSTSGLTIYNTTGTIVNLSGGTISTVSLNVNGAPARFNWTSGKLNLTAGVAFNSGAAGTSTAGAFGSSLVLGSNQTLMVTGNETLGNSGAFTLTLNSGSTNYVTGGITLGPMGTIIQNDGSTFFATTFTQAGGTVNGTLQNQGTFTYQSGSFAGRLLNQGTVNLGLNFMAANGIENDSSITVAVGQTVTANGAGFDNLGSLLLNGGTISGNGPIVNEFQGTVQGHGIVNPAVSNFGTLSVNGALVLNGGATNYGLVQGGGAISGSFSNDVTGTVNVAAANSLAVISDWTNNGLIVLQGTTARLGGGGITNAGTFQGIGSVSSAVNNAGTIEPIGGTLSISGTLLNPAGGLIRVSSGNKLLVTQGLLASAGIVNLTGGTFDNNGRPMNNLGQISGFGTFATGGTGLDNHGSITFSGGLTTVNGPVTNENLKTIVVAYNPAIFTGLVTNTGTGTFNVISTTVTFAGGSSGNVPPGAFTNSPAAAFAKAGSGALEVDSPPTLGNSSSLAVGDTGTLRFKAISGSATVGTGVTATVAAGATLELAGSVSGLSSGANRVNIVNGSNAPELLVSGTHQQVGNIDGTGTTQVNAGSDLTANHVVQNALVIGGAAGSPAVVTIDASDSSGNPLASGFLLASSLTPNGPLDAGGSLRSVIGDPANVGSSAAASALGGSTAGAGPLRSRSPRA